MGCCADPRTWSQPPTPCAGTWKLSGYGALLRLRSPGSRDELGIKRITVYGYLG